MMCSDHHRNRRRPASPAARDDRAPATGPVRAADADRERLAEALRGHAAAGRLDTAELERRLEAVYGATYVHELTAQLTDLPRAEGAVRQARTGGTVPNGLPLFLLLLGAIGLAAAVTGVWWLWFLAWPASAVLGGAERGKWIAAGRTGHLLQRRP